MRPYKKTLSHRIGRLIKEVADVLYPRHCCVCGRKLNSDTDNICGVCFTNLPFTHFKGAKGNTVERLFWGVADIERANALMYYDIDDRSRVLLYELKYNGHDDIGVQFGRIMAKDLEDTDFFEGVDCIVPVPLFHKKLKRRHYNQSERIAQGVFEITGIPVVTKALIRIKDTPTQTKLTKEERQENMTGAFSLKDADLVAGKHILLIDDVITTNSTLLSCINELKKAKGVRISVMTLALAGKHSKRPPHYTPV
ncbi:MAG: ComF family protein [Alloprevotella sp.]